MSRLVGQFPFSVPYVSGDLRCELVWEDVVLPARAQWIGGGYVRVVEERVVRAAVGIRLWDDHEPQTGERP